MKRLIGIVGVVLLVLVVVSIVEPSLFDFLQIRQQSPLPETTTVYAYGPNGLVSKQKGNEVSYYHKDNLGSSSLVTGFSGEVKYSTDYYPFGSSLHEEGEEKYTYNSKELDSTGLYYYGARYYDADIGRFISVDPVSGNLFDSQVLNRYSYVTNNPLKYVDPKGERRNLPRREIKPEEPGKFEGQNIVFLYGADTDKFIRDDSHQLQEIYKKEGANVFSFSIRDYTHADLEEFAAFSKEIDTLILAGHGNPEGINIGGEMGSSTIEEYFSDLKFRGDSKVILSSCLTACEINGEKSFAEEVSEILNVPVYASQNVAISYKGTRVPRQFLLESFGSFSPITPFDPYTNSFYQRHSAYTSKRQTSNDGIISTISEVEVVGEIIKEKAAVFP